MNGFSIGIDSISGWRLISSVNDNRLRSSRTTRWRNVPRISWVRPSSAVDRPGVEGDALGEPVVGGEVVDTRLGDGLGDHLIDVEIDMASLSVPSGASAAGRRSAAERSDRQS